MFNFLEKKAKEPVIKVLARERTQYNDIYVIQNGDYRELWFKGNGDYFLQSRVNTEQQKQLALVYSNMMMASLLFCPKPRRLLMIGLGGAAVTNFLSEQFPSLHIDVVDIDPKVIEVSKSIFICVNLIVIESLKKTAECSFRTEKDRSRMIGLFSMRSKVDPFPTI